MRTEDEYIIQQCLDGDAEAFGFLVDKYKKSVYALTYSRIRNFHDAQDITQEVFVKAYRNLRTLRSWDNFMGWLYRITANLSKNWLRSQSRRPDREFSEDQDPEVLEQRSLDFHNETEVYDSIREALDSLPEIYRQVLTLRYFGGMTIREMSRFIGVSPATIKRRLRRAQEQMREEMLATMRTSYEQNELPGSFTFCIVEMVKRIKIHPLPRLAGLPWGLSTSAVNGKIYIIGGYLEENGLSVALSDVIEYDTVFAVEPAGKLPTKWGGMKQY
jgi:RNA polymerase sigma factor (sigma-70 family)